MASPSRPGCTCPTLEADVLAATEASFEELMAESKARAAFQKIADDVQKVERRLNLRASTLFCEVTIEQNAEVSTDHPEYWRKMKSAAGGTIGCMAEEAKVDINAELGYNIY